MAKTIASAEQFDLRQSEDKRYYWVDTENGGTIAEDEVLTAYGIEENERGSVPSATAVYLGDFDRPVRIVKNFGLVNGESYLLTDTGEALPQSRLEWKDEADLPPSPQQRIEQLESDKAGLEGRIATLEANNSTLEARLTALENQPTREVGGFRLNDRVALRNEDPDAAEEFSRGYRVTGLSEEGTEDLIDIKNDTTSDEQQVFPDKIVHENDIPAEADQEVRQSPGLRQRFNRAAGWVGGLISQRQVELQDGVYSFVRTDNGQVHRTVIQETVVDGYPESQRNNGVVIVALGALAIAATAAAVYAFHKLGDHNATQEAIRRNAEATQKFRDHMAQLRLKELKETVRTDHNAINKLSGIVASLKDTIARENHTIAGLKDQVHALRMDEIKEHAKQAHEAVAGGKGTGGEAATAGANQIYVNPGHGYSQEIRDSFPGHSSADYFNAYKAGLHKFGKDFIQGISKYRMSDGNWGLAHPGAAHWAPRVHKFLESYFASRG